LESNRKVKFTVPLQYWRCYRAHPALLSGRSLQYGAITGGGDRVGARAPRFNRFGRGANTPPRRRRACGHSGPVPSLDQTGSGL